MLVAFVVLLPVSLPALAQHENGGGHPGPVAVRIPAPAPAHGPAPYHGTPQVYAAPQAHGAQPAHDGASRLMACSLLTRLRRP